MRFSQIFDSLLKEKGISNYEMSRRTGISDSLIGYWRKGERVPKADNLVTIANFLEVPTDYLLGRTDSEVISSSNSINNQAQSFQGTQTNVISAESSPRVDSMTAKFLEIFNNLDFQDQLDTMNFVMERRKKST